MIVVYKDWKRFLEKENLHMKNITHIRRIFNILELNIKYIPIPKMCEEPMQYIMRQNWYTLEGF